MSENTQNNDDRFLPEELIVIAQTLESIEAVKEWLKYNACDPPEQTLEKLLLEMGYSQQPDGSWMKD